MDHRGGLTAVRMTNRARRLRRSAAVGALAVTAMGGMAWASIPGASGTIKGCYARSNGLLLGIPYSKGDVRVVDSAESCRSYETTVSWSQKGPAGPQGLVGPPGPPGPQGDAGAGTLSGYEIVSAEDDTLEDSFGTPVFSVAVTCPGGKKALSGTLNGRWTALIPVPPPFPSAGSTGLERTHSAPTSDGTGWLAQGEVPEHQDGSELTVVSLTVVCANSA